MNTFWFTVFLPSPSVGQKHRSETSAFLWHKRFSPVSTLDDWSNLCFNVIIGHIKNVKTTSIRLLNYVFNCSTIDFISPCLLLCFYCTFGWVCSAKTLSKFPSYSSQLHTNLCLFALDHLHDRKINSHSGIICDRYKQQKHLILGASMFETKTNLSAILCELYHHVWCNAFQNWLRFASPVIYLQS